MGQVPKGQKHVAISLISLEKEHILSQKQMQENQHCDGQYIEYSYVISAFSIANLSFERYTDAPNLQKPVSAIPIAIASLNRLAPRERHKLQFGIAGKLILHLP